MSMFQVVYVVLLLTVKTSLPSVGVIEIICEYPFSVRLNLASLEVDATTVKAVEQVLDATSSPERSQDSRISWLTPI